MRGRPKKSLDKDLILKLHAEGLTTRQIAERIGKVNYATIARLLQNSPTSLLQNSTDVLQNSVAKPKTHSDVKPNLVAKPVSTLLPPTTNTPPARSELDAHHSAYSLAYKGKQPVSLLKFGLKGVPYYKFEFDDAVILAHTRRIIIWINKYVADRVEDIDAGTRGRARRIMAEFATKYGLELDPNSLIQKTDIHYVLTDGNTNDFLMDILLLDKSMAKELGITPGDASHPDNVEFTGQKGKDSLIRLKRVLDGEYEAKQGKDAEALKAKMDFIMDSLVSLSKNTDILVEKTNERFAMLEGKLDALEDRHLKAKILMRET